MKVSWDYDSHYFPIYGKNMFQTTNQTPYSFLKWWQTCPFSDTEEMDVQRSLLRGGNLQVEVVPLCELLSQEWLQNSLETAELLYYRVPIRTTV